MRIKFWTILLITLTTWIAPLFAEDKVTVSPEAEIIAKAISAELAQSCPKAEPGDQMAFDQCREKLFHSDLLHSLFAENILWGGYDASKDFYQLKLTHFSREIFLGLYLPLFMFEGGYKIDRNLKDHWIQLHIKTSFRNRLAPGQFPYPFWHDSHKWDAYQDATELLLRVDPVTLRVNAAMRAKLDVSNEANKEKVTPPAFDGKWLWNDENGKTQPAVTLFDGLFSADNPYKTALNTQYRYLALAFRDESCTSCHNPANPSKMVPLILMQTPAHAAGEIHHIIQSIEKDEMPLTEWGTKKILDPLVKADLLRRARAFAEIVDQAYAWESCHNKATTCP